MADWVHAAERAYVAAAGVGGKPAVAASTSSASPGEAAGTSANPRAIAAAGAIASHYLAVGTPRSFSLVIAGAADIDAAALALTAHRAWFAPRDVRCASLGDGGDALAAAVGGRVVSLDEALACDIVNVFTDALTIAPSQLRRGTHVNALSLTPFAAELLSLATVTRETGLPALAAGLVDGRQLDELTIFAADGAPVAAAALG